MGLFLWLIPLGAGLLLFFFRQGPILHLINVAGTAVMLTLSGLLTFQVIRTGAVAYPTLGGVFYADALSVLVLDLVVLIGFLSSLYAIGYLEQEKREGKLSEGKMQGYYLLMQAFLLTMVLVLTLKNLGLMWIAIEATTLASAFLVGFYNDRNAIEAAWKYIILCSVGIAIALLGIILLHLSSVGVLEEGSFLDWPALYEQAKGLDRATARLAFVFILIGFGTKVGLAPMHTWLPDAHSQAPSPISALLSGVLLNTAMYGIIRTLAIVNLNQGSSDYTGRLLIALGMVSLATAAVFILTQKDYKRLLAYSSIEHMGIVALSIGLFTPLSVFAGLLHMINHSFTKSMLFLASGTILQTFKTRQIGKVKGLLRVLPFTGTAFLIGLFAIAGTPPFNIFVSEFGLFLAIFEGKRMILGGVFILLLAMVFIGMAVTMLRMFYGEVDPLEEQPAVRNPLGMVVIGLLLVVVIFTGLFLPEGVKDLILQAQDLILGV